MRHLALITAIGLALVVPARSQGASSPRAREKAAKKACAAGDYRKGVEILAELYVDTDNVTHIYNQGRCYEQNHQWVSAIDRFREYLRKNSRGTAAERSDAEKHIADCEALHEQEEPKLAPPPVTAPPPAPVMVVPSEPPPSTTPESVVVAQPAPPPVGRGAGLRVTGIVLGSVGVATAVVGLVLNLKANDLADTYNRVPDDATKSSNSSYKTGSMVCYGVGGGLAVAGVVLYLVGRSAGRSEQPSQVSLLPVLTPSGFSLSLRSIF